MNARDTSPATYQVLHLLSYPWLGGTPSLVGGVPHPWMGGYPIPGWGLPIPSHPWMGGTPSLAKGGTPYLDRMYPPPVCTYKQTENITFPHPSDAGGNDTNCNCTIEVHCRKLPSCASSTKIAGRYLNRFHFHERLGIQSWQQSKILGF